MRLVIWNRTVFLTQIAKSQIWFAIPPTASRWILFLFNNKYEWNFLFFIFLLLVLFWVVLFSCLILLLSFCFCFLEILTNFWCNLSFCILFFSHTYMFLNILFLFFQTNFKSPPYKAWIIDITSWIISPFCFTSTIISNIWNIGLKIYTIDLIIFLM